MLPAAVTFSVTKRSRSSSSDQQWLPGMTWVPPLSAVNASTAQIVLTLIGARGRGIG